MEHGLKKDGCQQYYNQILHLSGIHIQKNDQFLKYYYEVYGKFFYNV